MTMKLHQSTIVVVLLKSLSVVLCSKDFIKGLPPSKLALYDASKDFQCLDGSLSIPFTHVNDDYCDCADGTDEPGTSACPNGSFYCRNPGYKPLIVPSSRINDGICDCCDGEDEYNSRTQCANYCNELGLKLKEEEERSNKLRLEGYTMYLDYARQGVETRSTKQARMQELQKQLDEVDMERAVLEKRKNELEEPEKEAKERHEKWWEEEKTKRKEDNKLQAAREAFESLDENHDERVSTAELATHSEFDIDSNGEVSVDEAKEYLEENDEVSFDTFVEKVWDNIREIYRAVNDAPSSTANTDTEVPPVDDDRLSDYKSKEESEFDGEERYSDTGDDDSDEEHEDSDDYHEPKKQESDKKEDVEEKMPDYDENTKYLIQAADEARREYNAVDSKYRDIDNEIKDIKKVVEQDLGENGEYYPLMGQCFDFTDREYVYSLCPFDRASQRGKNGGVETSLGRWGSWAGVGPSAKYDIMKYEHGLNCWNGPNRSATVHIECGLQNELVSVTEPNRCEYRFAFHTPAACNQPPQPADSHVPHSEL